MKNNYEKILSIFFDDITGKFYIREIAELTKLNPNTVLNISRILLKEELIKRNKKKHVVELSANVNEKFKRLKKINNISRIYDSGLIEFLIDEFSPEVVSVIGSYSDGSDIKESDLDIVVIINKQEKTSLSVAKFEKFLKRKIHLIVSDYKNISNEFYTNLINGVVLFGYLRRK